MTAADTIARLRAAQARAERAIYTLTAANVEAVQALEEARRAFDAAGCTDEALIRGNTTGLAAMASLNIAVESLELARDCCDSLAADLALDTPIPTAITEDTDR